VFSSLYYSYNNSYSLLPDNLLKNLNSSIQINEKQINFLNQVLNEKNEKENLFILKDISNIPSDIQYKQNIINRFSKPSTFGERQEFEKIQNSTFENEENENTILITNSNLEILKKNIEDNLYECILTINSTDHFSNFRTLQKLMSIIKNLKKPTSEDQINKIMENINLIKNTNIENLNSSFETKQFEPEYIFKKPQFFPSSNSSLISSSFPSSNSSLISSSFPSSNSSLISSSFPSSNSSIISSSFPSSNSSLISSSFPSSNSSFNSPNIFSKKINDDKNRNLKEKQKYISGKENKKPSSKISANFIKSKKKENIGMRMKMMNILLMEINLFFIITVFYVFFYTKYFCIPKY
jgi:hypothetical protein